MAEAALRKALEEKVAERENQLTLLYKTNAELMERNAVLAQRNVEVEKEAEALRKGKAATTLSHKSIEALLQERKEEAHKWAAYTAEIKQWGDYEKKHKEQAEADRRYLKELQEKYKTLTIQHDSVKYKYGELESMGKKTIEDLTKRAKRWEAAARAVRDECELQSETSVSYNAIHMKKKKPLGQKELSRAKLPVRNIFKRCNNTKRRSMSCR